ncbi:MAG: hypothetical protein SGI99_00365 [Pseudomonadota bacterium]|nr:hypothetical protein [Pseudomonadota bacterium]
MNALPKTSVIKAGVITLSAVVATVLCVFAPAVGAEARGNAIGVLQREHTELSAQLAPEWQEALARMSATQLDALRHGASVDSIVLDGDETLLDFMTRRRVVDVPPELLVAPVGGGTARGGTFLIDAQLLPKGSGAPNGSLVGGTLRLDPLLPGGGGTSGSAQFQLTASIGQPTVATSNSSQTTLMKPGFWTPTNAVAVTQIFRDGFE